MARTQEERKADTRARLLEAAAAQFAERGIDAVSVDAVAEAAGRTSGAVYAHFGSKQGMLLALLDEWAHSLVTVIAAEFELADTLEDRLRAVATNVITKPSEQTRRLLLLERELWLRAARDPEVAAALQTRSREAQDWLTRGFAAWIADGLVPASVPPQVLAISFRALVVGIETHHAIDPGTLDTDTVAAALATVLGADACHETQALDQTQAFHETQAGLAGPSELARAGVVATRTGSASRNHPAAAAARQPH